MMYEVTTHKVSSTKGTYHWDAIRTEALYCLFTCEHCQRINTAHLHAVITARSKQEDAALQRLEEVSQEVVEKLKTPGPKSGDLFATAKFKCRCAYCEEEPIWVSAIRKGNTNEIILSALAIAVLVAVWLAIAVFSVQLDLPKWLNMLLFFVLISLSIAAFIALGMHGTTLVWNRVARIIEDGTRENPPLFGDTIEEVVQQAQASEAYHHLSFDGVSWPYQTGERRQPANPGAAGKQIGP